VTLEPSLPLALAGGVLIGAAVGVLVLVTGRVSSITGIVAGAISPPVREAAWRAAFVAGLIVGGSIVPAVAPDAVGGFDQPWPLLTAAGFLVGWGARFGGGCTSGHGVCGVGRLSPRSMVGCGVFVLTAMVVVYLTRHVL
jgi:uncharacterized membrane protein YedE/YeeE